jgi:hypothetical protein
MGIKTFPLIHLHFYRVVEGESTSKSISLNSFEKYVPTQHIDYPTPNLVQFCSITAMPSYSNLSFEELRDIYYISLITSTWVNLLLE